MNKWEDEIARREYEAEQRQKQQVAEVTVILGFCGFGMIAVGVVLASWIHYA